MEVRDIIGFFKEMNSFDYIFIAYLLGQAYWGYRQGFRLMLYQMVRWIVLALGVLAANQILLPFLMQSGQYVAKAKQFNYWCYAVMMDFAPEGNELSEMLYQKMAESIPYDQILFYLVVIILISLATKVFIVGTLWGEETEGKFAGLLLGIARAIGVCFIFMKLASVIMAIANPEAFELWQEESSILSLLGIKF